jgi:mono/diheme cytochrome c family protein
VLLTIIIALMIVKHLMNTRYHFKGWLLSIFAVLILAGLLVSLLLKPAAAAAATTDPAAASGRQVFDSLGCAVCHMQAGGQIAPALDGLHGSIQILADGSKVLADDAYLRRSILEPQTQIVKGYAPAMPSYAGRISDPQLEDLLAYLRSIGTAR